MPLGLFHANGGGRGKADAGRQCPLSRHGRGPSVRDAKRKGPVLAECGSLAVQRRGWREMGSVLHTDVPDIEVQGDPIQGSQKPFAFSIQAAPQQRGTAFVVTVRAHLLPIARAVARSGEWIGFVATLCEATLG